MGFTRYATVEVQEILDLKGSATQQKTANLDLVSSYEDYRTEDGYLYARIRAISSRVNKNHDAWPSVELAGDHSIIGDSRLASGNGFTVEASEDNRYGFSSFLGKPIFVDHNNSNPQRARGVIVDARLHVEPQTDDPYYKTADCHPSFKPATWVELLLEVDAKSFPKLAQAIIDGSQDSSRGIDGFSMGANVERSVCSHCANVATSPDEFCKHIAMKGAHWDYHDPKTGRKTSKRSYEFCEGVQFFEISAVFDPADETALTREIRASVEKEADMGIAPPDPGMATDPNANNPPAGSEVCPMCHGAKVFQGGLCPECRGLGYIPMGTQAGGQSGDPAMTEPAGGGQFGMPVAHTAAVLKVPCPHCGDHNAEYSTNNGSGFCQNCGVIDGKQIQTGGDGAHAPAQIGPDDTDEPYYQNEPNINLDGSPWGLVDRPADLGPVHQGARKEAEGVEDIQAELDEAPSAVADPKIPWAWINDPEKRDFILTKAFARAKASGDTDALRNFLTQSGLKKEVIAKTAQKVADAMGQIPQFDLESAPSPIDTLQAPITCPTCGAEMDGEECDVCHTVRPPEGMGNPDIEKAHENVQNRLHGEDAPVQPPAIPKEQSELQDQTNPPTPPPTRTQNLGPVSHVTGDMASRWRSVEAGRINTVEVPIRSGSKPATNEPDEKILSDQATAVTSSVRTAADFIAVAGAITNTGEPMDKTADATAQAPDAAKPKTQVDVTGTGGVDEASNEQASKADSQVNVLDHGGVDSDVAADSHETLPDSSGPDDAGFNSDKTTDGSGPTRTWNDGYGDSLGQQSPVTDEPWPASDQGVKKSHDDGVFPKDDGGLAGGGAQQGNEPIDPSFKADERVDVLDHVTSPSNNSGPTKTWSGTDGNGVNKQQDPVTPSEVYPSEGGVTKGSSAHMYAAFKLADAEVKAGLLTEEDKFVRIAELEGQDPIACKIGMEYVARIKTAGLGKQAKVASRVPSFAQAKTASQVEPNSAENPYDVKLPGEDDAATFM
jgi:hypothetical protein